MEGVEDLPGSVLHEGLPWNWERIEEYLDALDGRPHDDGCTGSPRWPGRGNGCGCS
jgi:N-acyl-D-aspartate/D-glutamate deacylase